MEPISMLAATTVTLLAPYLKKLAEGAASEAGKAAWGAATQVYQAVAARFGRQPDSAAALESVKAAPDDPARQEDLRTHLERVIGADPDFQKTLLGLLDKAADSGVDNSFNIDIKDGVKNMVVFHGDNHGPMNFS
jgi:hypothetical protein